MKTKMLIFDVETKLAILKSNQEKLDGYQYCKGFEDFRNMGISCVCGYDYHTQDYKIFLEDNLDDFRKLVNNPDYLLIGFNSEKFDVPLLSENGIHIIDFRHYDIHRMIQFGTEEFHQFNFSLNKICEVNFGIKKSGSGSLAPILWQQKKYGQVIDYCLHDVKMIKILFDKIMSDGYIINPKKSTEIIPVSKPKLFYPMEMEA